VKRFLRRLLVPTLKGKRAPGHLIAIPRNVIASLIATGCEALFIVALVETLSVRYLWAVAGGLLLSTTISFILNKYWVFEAPHGRLHGQYLRQGVLAGGSFGWNLFLTWLMTEKLGTHYVFSFITASVVVFIAWNYPGARLFVFTDGYKEEGPTGRKVSRTK
jgi:putative flippase GtrA